MTRRRYMLRVAALLAIAWALAPAGLQAAEGVQPTWLDLGETAGYSGSAIRFGYWGSHVTGSETRTGEFQSLDASPFWDLDGIASSGTRTLDYSLTGTNEEGTQAGLHYFGPRMSVDIDYDRYLRRYGRDELVNFQFPPDQPRPFTPVPSGAGLPNADNLLTSGNPLVVARDQQDIGEDYAIRRQEYDARFQGNLTEILKWRLNVWGIKKSGDRQTVALGHCYSVAVGPPDAEPVPPATTRSFTTCHMESQRQQIDWVTNEIEPVLEANLGPVTIEYSRPMRSFSQDDSIVTRNYTQGGHADWISPLAGQVPYAVTPENFTQIDKLKVSAELTDTDHFYAYLMNGQTENKHRNVNREFNNIDMRLIDQTLPGLTVTGYGKRYHQAGELPPNTPFEEDIIQGPTALTTAQRNALIAQGVPLTSGDNNLPAGLATLPSTTNPAGVANPLYDPNYRTPYREPINYTKSGGGVKGRWTPYESGWCLPQGLGFFSGYEYTVLARDHAETEFEPETAGHFVQPDTITNAAWLGTEMRWSACFDTYVRYRIRDIQDPLYGLRIHTTDINSALPTDEDLVEVGGTWFPTENFLLSATVGFESRQHQSFHENFNPDYDLLVDNVGNPLLGRPLPNPRETYYNEDNYPVTISTWWAPTCNWSLSAGYATFQSYLGQLITLGDDYNDGFYNPTSSTTTLNPNPSYPDPSNPTPFLPARDYVEADAFQSLWRHRTRSHVVNVGTNYQWSDRLSLLGGMEYVRGEDVTLPTAPAESYNPLKDSAGNYVINGQGANTPPDWTSITPGSDVISETWRVTGGVDYMLGRRVSTFFRYNLYRFGDLAGNEGNGNGGTGTAHLFLGGLTALY